MVCFHFLKVLQVARLRDGRHGEMRFACLQHKVVVEGIAYFASTRSFFELAYQAFHHREGDIGVQAMVVVGKHLRD
jgi:hypothetical protein